MNAQTDSDKLSFGLALLFSFIAVAAGPEFREFQRWTDHSDWLANLHWSLIAAGFIWCAVLLPWAFIVKIIYHKKKWRRFRTFWIILPGLSMFCLVATKTISSPPTAEKRFKEISDGVALPDDASNLKYHFWGGTWTPHKDTYYFDSSPPQVDRLILDMRLKPEDHESVSKGPRITDIKVLPMAPDPKSWKGSLHYSRDDNWRFIRLVANAQKTQVYIYTERMELP